VSIATRSRATNFPVPYEVRRRTGAVSYGAASYGAASYGAASYGAALYGAASYGAASVLLRCP
jgi:hypothetical protein